MMKLPTEERRTCAMEDGGSFEDEAAANCADSTDSNCIDILFVNHGTLLRQT